MGPGFSKVVCAGTPRARATRQPIPNLAVKLCSGDNTAGASLWEDSEAPAAYCTTSRRAEALPHMACLPFLRRLLQYNTETPREDTKCLTRIKLRLGLGNN